MPAYRDTGTTAACRMTCRRSSYPRRGSVTCTQQILRARVLTLSCRRSTLRPSVARERDRTCQQE